MQGFDKKQYVETVTDQIRCKQARALVAEELEQHIDDQTEEFVREGMEPEEAGREAVREMGDPVTTGVELDRIHRPKVEWKLLLLVGVLTFSGLGIQYMLEGGIMSDIFVRQILYTVLGIAAMAAVYFMDYTVIGKYPLLLWGGLVLFLGVGMFLASLSAGGFGLFRSVNGQYRIYPLLILLIPLFGGVLYRFRGRGYGGLLLCGGAAAVGLLLAYTSGNGTAMFDLLFVFAAMLIRAVGKGWFRIRKSGGYLLICGGIVSVIAFGCFLIISGIGRGVYLFRRIETAFYPERYADTLGYTAIQLRELTGKAEMIGKGAAVSGTGIWSTSGQLTDLMFSGILVSFGILAGVLVLALLAGLLVKLFSMAFRQKNQLGSMLSFGCACLFLSETIVYVSYNLGFTLFGPVYLPFLSCAGRGTVSLFALMGLLLSVYRNTNLVKEKKPGELPRYRLRLEKL